MRLRAGEFGALYARVSIDGREIDAREADEEEGWADEYPDFENDPDTVIRRRGVVRIWFNGDAPVMRVGDAIVARKGVSR